jgi:hypothetical protein
MIRLMHWIKVTAQRAIAALIIKLPVDANAEDSERYLEAYYGHQGKLASSEGSGTWSRPTQHLRKLVVGQFGSLSRAVHGKCSKVTVILAKLSSNSTKEARNGPERVAYGIWGRPVSRNLAIQSAWGRPQAERAFISLSASYSTRRIAGLDSSSNRYAARSPS